MAESSLPGRRSRSPPQSTPTPAVFWRRPSPRLDAQFSIRERFFHQLEFLLIGGREFALLSNAVAASSCAAALCNDNQNDPNNQEFLGGQGAEGRLRLVSLSSTESRSVADIEQRLSCGTLTADGHSRSSNPGQTPTVVSSLRYPWKHFPARPANAAEHKNPTRVRYPADRPSFRSTFRKNFGSRLRKRTRCQRLSPRAFGHRTR